MELDIPEEIYDIKEIMYLKNKERVLIRHLSDIFEEMGLFFASS